MNHKKIDLGGRTFKDVFGFAFTHWSRQRHRIAAIIVVALSTAAADIMTPWFARHLVDALARAGLGKAHALYAVLAPFASLIALALAGALLRYFTYFSITGLTLRMMSDIADDAFHRVQRLSPARVDACRGSLNLARRAKRAADVSRPFVYADANVEADADAMRCDEGGPLIAVDEVVPHRHVHAHRYGRSSA